MKPTDHPLARHTHPSSPLSDMSLAADYHRKHQPFRSSSHKIQKLIDAAANISTDEIQAEDIEALETIGKRLLIATRAASNRDRRLVTRNGWGRKGAPKLPGARPGNLFGDHYSDVGDHGYRVVDEETGETIRWIGEPYWAPDLGSLRTHLKDQGFDVSCHAGSALWNPGSTVAVVISKSDKENSARIGRADI